MIGGILLFSEALAEDEELLYESSDNLPVAYASNNVNSTANLARGSLNLTESMALSSGYKFVWEFTPNQGNGTIAAVALTSALGGQNGFGSLVGDASAFLQLKAADIGVHPGRQQDGAVRGGGDGLSRTACCIPSPLRTRASGSGSCGSRCFPSG